MLAPEVIRRKRDGATLSQREIDFLVAGIADGGLSDAQVGALAMAFFLRGLEGDERIALTKAMRDSGTVLEWDLDRPVLDKHSTGGVGDKVSLILAPVLAACGAAVPMISGRGLGHTGGTLDKLDSIPGYTSTPATEVIKRVVSETGCAIVGQTADLAPADRRLYAVRDATGTVESIPLIVASILSKKLAEGLDALVLDVKTGSGAFMAAREDAQKLAEALVEVAKGAGLDTVALLTDMDEVLGTTAGNALEVRESVDFLTGAAREARLHEVTVALAAAALVQSRLAPDEQSAREKVERSLDDGSAAERFGAMVTALGGPSDFVENPALPVASVTRPVAPERPGYIERVDARAVGLVVTALGGNRRREDDQIDHGVGPQPDRPDRRRGRPRPPAGARPRARRRERDRGRHRAAVRRPCEHGAAGAAARAAGPGMTPLAELHVHLEGTVPPALIQKLADRNGLRVPDGVFAAPDRFQWVDFLDFLRTYDLAASVIRTAEDYRDITYEYLTGCAAEGAIYVELIVSPDHAGSVGLSDSDHYGGIAAGIDDARRDSGIEGRMIVTAIRNFGVEAAVDIARREHHPYVVGFNLAGDEAGYPASLFREAYAIAAGAGLGCTCHAGEHDGADSVRQALELPGLTRISHGVRAIEDPRLVEQIAERGIVLEVCPTSNVATGVFESYDAHPLGRLHEAGVKLTLGSDDPPYFGATIGGEYAVARERFGFEEGELKAITRTAVQGSFADDAVKRALLNRITASSDRRSQ